MTDRLELAAASLLWLAVMFCPLEWAFPMWRSQRRARPGWLADLAFFVGQYVLFGALAVAAVSALARHFPGDVLPHGIAQLPAWFKAVLAVMVGDLLMYGGHRLQHRVDALWRFHAIHHTSTHLDWLAAHREHPLDGLYTQTLMNLPAIALGLRVDAVLGLVAFRSLWAIFIHSNVRLPLGPLALVLGSPSLHHAHHAKERDAGNYANLAPYLDKLFGTYRAPTEEPPVLGIREAHPTSYWALLAHPFLPRRLPNVRRAEPTSIQARL